MSEIARTNDADLREPFKPDAETRDARARGTSMILAGGLFAAVVLSAIGALAYRESVDSTERARLSVHTMRVLSELKDVSKTIEAAETGQRGFLLTGQEVYLDQVNGVDARLGTELDELSMRVRDNPQQTARVRQLKVAISDRLELMSGVLKLERSGQKARAIAKVREGGGLELMSKVRGLLSEMEREEEKLFQVRNAAFEDSETKSRCTIIGATLAAMFFVGLSAFFGLRELSLRRKTENELKQARDQAIRALQAKSVFLSSMSHEIRTPLNAIIGMTDALSDTELNPCQTRYIKIFRRAGNVLLNLINDVLDLSKIEAGKLLIDEHAVSVQELVDQCIDILSFRASQKGLELKTMIHPSVPSCFLGDSNRLRQVLLNLLGNAIKFTAVGTVALTVETRDESAGGTSVLFSVMDTGKGIPAAKQVRIFQKFDQIDPSIVTEFGGTGLGLTISRQLVELMGGEIWFKSREHSGTTFYFTIPCRETTGFVAKGTGQTASRFERCLSILVVDDVEDNRAIVEAHLCKTRHSLAFAENGLEAFRKLQSGAFDLVLMDMHMPVMDGFVATQAIRNWEEANGRKPVPIIALTAYAFKEEVDATLKAGCTSHATKPITREALLRAIALEVERMECAKGKEEVVKEEGKADERIEVRIRPGTEHLIPKFMANRKADFENLAQLMERGDLNEIEAISHKLKGTCGSYGFERISAICAELNLAARAGDHEAAKAHFETLRRDWERVEVIMPGAGRVA